jgi:hypothetical protein
MQAQIYNPTNISTFTAKKHHKGIVRFFIELEIRHGHQPHRVETP